MSISRRQLYAFGEPLGECVTRLDAGRRVCGGGGGGGSNTSTGTTYTTNIPEYAQQPFMNLVGRAEAVSTQPYQPYTGQRIEGFNPMQQQSFQNAAGQQTAPQIGMGTGLAAGAATSSFTNPGMMQAYMSPYMQGVVQSQQNDAIRQAGVAGNQRNAAFTKAGAFGGSRQAIENAEANRNLMTQLGDIQSRGLQSAFESGQGQFNAEMNRGLQGAQTLGQLGQQQFGQQMDITQMLNTMGSQVQQQGQRQLDQQYNDFQAQRDYPYQQLGFLSDILRGTSGSTRTMYSSAPQPSGLQQLAGLGTAAAGLGKLFRGGGLVALAGGGLTPYAPYGRRTQDWRVMLEQGNTPAAAPVDPLAAADLAARENRGYGLTPTERAAFLRKQQADTAQREAGAQAGAQGRVYNPEQGSYLGQGVDTGDETSRLLSRYPAPQEQAGPPVAAMEQPDGGSGRSSLSISSLLGAAGASPAGATLGAPPKFEYDAEGEQRKAEERAREITKAEAEAAQKDIDEFDAAVAARGVYGKEREARIKAEQGGLEQKDRDAKNMALVEAGLAILAADPSRGAFAAIGEGALKGLGAYKGDAEKLQAQRAALTGKLDEIEDLRRQEAVADGRERRTLTTARRKAETDGARMLQQIGLEFGTKVKFDAAKTQFQTLAQQYEGAQNRASAERIAAGNQAATLKAASMRAGSGAGGTKDAAILQRAAADVDRALKDDIEYQTLKISDPAAAEVYRNEQLDERARFIRLQSGPSASSGAGTGVQFLGFE